MRHAAGEMLGEGEQVVVPKAASLKEPTQKLFLLSAQHPQSAVVFYLLTAIPHVQIFLQGKVSIAISHLLIPATNLHTDTKIFYKISMQHSMAKMIRDYQFQFCKSTDNFLQNFHAVCGRTCSTESKGPEARPTLSALTATSTAVRNSSRSRLNVTSRWCVAPPRRTERLKKKRKKKNNPASYKGTRRTKTRAVCMQTVQTLRKDPTAFTVTIGTRDFTGSGRRSGRCQDTRGALSEHAQYNMKVVESRSRPALPQAQKGEPHKHRSHLGHLLSAGRGLHTVHTNKLSRASHPD